MRGAGQLLAGARRDLVTQQLEDPVLRIDLAQLLGEVYRAFGRADLAVALFERAAADGTLALGPEAQATLNAQIELALAYWDLSANTEAMRVLTTMIPAATQSLGSTHRLTLWAHDVLAAVLLDLGRYQEALVHAELAYKGALETAGPENHDTAVFARRYAEILRVLGRIEEANPLEAGVLEALARSRGQYHPTTIQERFMIISRRRQEGDPQAILEVPAIIDLLRAHTGERSAVTTLAETTFATWLIEDEQYAQATDYLASLTNRLLPISPTNKQHREILSMLEQAAGLADRPDLVAKAQQHALQPPQLPVWVYDEPLTQQIYAPSGHMGETQTTNITIYARDESQPDRGSFVRISLKPETSWAGIVWQDPPQNWGTRPGGFDLTAATRIVFDARSPQGHGLFTIGMGTRANDQHRADTGFIEEQFTATREWQTFYLDVSAIDRSRIFSGVVFVVSGTAEQVTIDLDRIRYE
ncbi:MAG: tetratricopeptide repeat protein [Phycisphaeraceae bacterium]